MEPTLRDGVLISESDIATRVTDIAKQLSKAYAGRELVAVIILGGGFIFAGDLLRRIDSTVKVRLGFISASSYGSETVSSGDVQVGVDLAISVAGADVLVIDDILESGETLTRIRDLIQERGAASVRVATLLHKKDKLKRPFTADYVGFEIPDVFVVGYGLDFAEYYRNLPDIRVLGE